MNKVTLPEAAVLVTALDLAIGFVMVFRYADDPAIATWKPRPVTGSEGDECTSFGLGIPAGVFAAEAEAKVEELADCMY